MITHYTELIERHEITASVPVALPLAYRAARDWLAAEGQIASLEEFERADCVGVRFEIIVAHAVEQAGDHPRWRWGQRWRDWLHKFSALHRAQTLAPAHPAAPGADVIPFRCVP